MLSLQGATPVASDSVFPFPAVLWPARLIYSVNSVPAAPMKTCSNFPGYSDLGAGLPSTQESSIALLSEAES